MLRVVILASCCLGAGPALGGAAERSPDAGTGLGVQVGIHQYFGLGWDDWDEGEDGDEAPDARRGPAALVSWVRGWRYVGGVLEAGGHSWAGDGHATTAFAGGGVRVRSTPDARGEAVYLQLGEALFAGRAPGVSTGGTMGTAAFGATIEFPGGIDSFVEGRAAIAQAGGVDFGGLTVAMGLRW